MVGDAGHQAEIVGGGDPLTMAGRIARRDLLRVIALVERLAGKADRAGFDRPVARLGHQGNDRRRIDPARQERAERNVGDHPRAHRRAHQVGQFLLAVGHARVGPA